MNIINWLVTSSKDSDKISLTIKSVVALAVLIGFDSTVVSQAGNQFATLITGAGMVLSAGSALWGLGRKIKFGRWSARPSDNYN